VRGTIGTITEQEIKEAALTEPKTIIIGFNISLPQRIRDIAKQAGVEVNSFRIIYGLVDWMRSVLGKMLRPTEKIEVLSKADVLEIFPVQQGKKVVYVAGCRISQGTFKRGKVTQVLRNDKVVFEGIVRTLKHYKQDVNSVQSGKECGIAFGDHFGEFQVGDVIQTIEKTLEERTIESPFST
jgi:translation initiation factor IF-2